MSAKKNKSAKVGKKNKKKKVKKDPLDVQLDPEVVAFSNWFVDWWLRRGLRAVEAAEAADPDYRKKQKQARRNEERLPLRWNVDGTALVMDDCDPEVDLRPRR
jgi:hypothetical protein